MKRNLILLTLFVALPALGTALDLPAPAPDPATTAPADVCGATVGENPAAVPPRVAPTPPPAQPQKGPPFLKGWCRFGCGSIQCQTSADCPDGVPCDSFIICTLRDSQATLADAAIPEGSSN